MAGNSDEVTLSELLSKGELQQPYTAVGALGEEMKGKSVLEMDVKALPTLPSDLEEAARGEVVSLSLYLSNNFIKARLSRLCSVSCKICMPESSWLM